MKIRYDAHTNIESLTEDDLILYNGRWCKCVTDFFEWKKICELIETKDSYQGLEKKPQDESKN